MHSPEAPIASVIIPGYNEERGIGRLLNALTTDTRPGEFDIIVVCNGCTDRTADVARRYQPAVRVVELGEPSKSNALKHGDELAGGYPRLYIDSDVIITSASVRALAGALCGTVMAAAPMRVLPRDGVSLLVRSYYDVWERLPQVRAMAFGRGVVALSESGHERLRSLPKVMSDDLAMTAAFTGSEFTVVPDASVVIRPPCTLRDLMRRRTRVNTGNAQLIRSAELRTSPRALLGLARAEPRLVPKIAVFASLALAARLAAQRRVRRGDFSTWLRDESSRAGG
jgi:hypothetical protein